MSVKNTPTGNSQPCHKGQRSTRLHQVAIRGHQERDDRVVRVKDTTYTVVKALDQGEDEVSTDHRYNSRAVELFKE